jgi:pyruvate/2-oxoglutarate dehydrogenase complex dihydrolipoamide acyltransferase (E2) component
MAYEFKLPDIGEGMAEGEIVRWLVKEGDTLTQDQPMVEVMTDKATVEIATPHAGRVLERRFKEGERCPVGEILIVIEVTAEADKTPSAGMAKTPGPTTEGASGGILATPATRRLAREMGVDLAKVKGSGPGAPMCARPRSARAPTTPSTTSPRRASPRRRSAMCASHSAACAA